jgi:glycosyltransferase involved in cell wall biosynthesis
MLDPYFKRSFPLKHLKKWAFWVPVQYWALRRARSVLFTTAAERDLAAQSFWLRRWNAMVVGLGAETPPEGLPECVSAFHQFCPAVRGKRYLLFLGRIDPKKGCDLLVDAFSSTRNSDPDLHLVMAGPDSSGWRVGLQAAAAQAGVAERVHWPGMLTGAVKWGAFAACEAFILPSHQENFGIAIAEALSCGKPVLITTPINISADMAADGCALVEDDTLDGTRRLIGRWLALTGEQRATMGERALVSFAARYEIRRSAAAIVEAFAPPLQPQARALAEAGRV